MKRLVAALALLVAAMLPSAIHSITTVSPGASGGSSSGGTAGSPAGLGATTVGQNWIISRQAGQVGTTTFQTFNPFGRTDGGLIPNRVFMSFIDDVNMIAFGPGAPVSSGAISTFLSSDGGATWRVVLQTTGAWDAAHGELNGARRLPSGSYVFTSGGSTCPTGPFWTTSGPPGTFTNAPCTGTIPSGAGQPSEVNVNTILSQVGSSGGAAHETVCRSANLGGSFACTPMTISGWTGGSGSRMLGTPNGAQGFGIVSAGVWVAVVNDSGDGNIRFLRSIDDGVTWTQTFNTLQTSAFPGINCLSSSICLAVNNATIWRSTDGGVTWATVVTNAPGGTLTGLSVFSPTVASALPWPGANTIRSVPLTTDAGLTWSFPTLQGGSNNNGSCPQSTGAQSGIQSVAVRNGRAVFTTNYGTLTSPGCAHYASAAPGGTVIAGANGVSLNITLNGAASVTQDEGMVNGMRTPWVFAPRQRPTIRNSSTTGAANTAVTITMAAVQAARIALSKVEAFCAAAGTAQLTITDNAVTVYLSPAAGIPTAPATLERRWNPPLTSILDTTAMVITAGACGAGNTTTLHVQAEQY